MGSVRTCVAVAWWLTACSSVAPGGDAGGDGARRDATGALDGAALDGDATVDAAALDGDAAHGGDAMRGPDGGPPAPVEPPTMEDFWNRQAYFEFENRTITSSAPDGSPSTDYNANGNVVVVGAVAYLFSREFVPPPSYCPRDSARTVVRSSTDGGHTWSAKTVVVDQVPGTPQECAALDGDAIFDAPSRTWHYVYQCLARDPGGWQVCHASRASDDPRGLFTPDPANPVIRNGALWSRITPSPALHDEGTPGFVAHTPGNYYVGFHGIDSASPIHVYRGIARTADFHTWTPVNTGPVFGPADCMRWTNVPWAGGRCYGGGAATVARDRLYNYLIVESADQSGGCVNGQTWVHGILRSRSDATTSPAWETPSDGAISFATRETWTNGLSPACALAYPYLYQDTAGTQHLLVFRRGSDRFAGGIDADDAHGHFQYALVRGGPVVHYAFREGPTTPARAYTQSDALSRGDLEARIANVDWSTDSNDGTFSLALNGTSSQLEAALDGTAYAIAGDFELTTRARFDALPTGGSALLAGKPGSYWLEFYANGQLCAFVYERASHLPRSACSDLHADLTQWHTYAATLAGTTLSLVRDGVAAAHTTIAAGGPAPSGTPFRVGSTSTAAGAFLGSFRGLLDDVALYDHYAYAATDRVATVANADGHGYWIATADGDVFALGSAAFHGSARGTALDAPIVGMAATPDGNGYWLVASDGGVFAYGSAGFHGSAASTSLHAPIVGMAATPDGNGYWLVASDGGVFAYGSAGFHGSAGGMTLVRPVVGMAATHDGGGYWLVASDGGVFAYGNAGFHGSAGGMTLSRPVVGMTATSNDGGYWLVASDGGVFAYGNAGFHGSAGAITLSQPVIGMARNADGGGYWLVAADGGVFTYGSAVFYGSAVP